MGGVHGCEWRRNFGRIWREGNIEMTPGNLNRKQAEAIYTWNDIRFTWKNGYLYAYLMAWPENGIVVINSLKNEMLKRCVCFRM